MFTKNERVKFKPDYAPKYRTKDFDCVGTVIYVEGSEKNKPPATGIIIMQVKMDDDAENTVPIYFPIHAFTKA